MSEIKDQYTKARKARLRRKAKQRKLAKARADRAAVAHGAQLGRSRRRANRGSRS